MTNTVKGDLDGDGVLEQVTGSGNWKQVIKNGAKPTAGRGPGGVGAVHRLPHHRATGSVPGPGSGLRRRAGSGP